MMAQHDPRERYWSLMVLNAVGRHMVVLTYHVMPVVPAVVMVVGVIRVGVVVVRLLRCLPLRVLLVLHPPVLEPDLHLPLRQVEVPGQLPPLLLRDVRVEQELFL